MPVIIPINFITIYVFFVLKIIKNSFLINESTVVFATEIHMPDYNYTKVISTIKNLNKTTSWSAIIA